MFLRKRSTPTRQEDHAEQTFNPAIHKVKFYDVQDVINAKNVVDEAMDGNLIFLNVTKIARYPNKRISFLKALKLCAEERDTTLRKISEDTYMVAPNSLPIEIKTLNSK